ncbi:glycosyltransferase family 2 protein [Liquorilactobacillus mali]|uniref:glycosyltransferase family 2 protein n=1 Tax=Liquorilactobacillus mali TaxID=1618 RepID=UPI002954EEF2|nr:glycosyltransferase [Liquorilactobacillus mali]MDV7757572.1 glycosyltransferase [Liquorilactobacillus mali]
MKKFFLESIVSFLGIFIGIKYLKFGKMSQKTAYDVLNNNDLKPIGQIQGENSEEKVVNDEKKLFDLNVIVPVYNAENFVEECLNSIISNKTEFNYQITIINDGSSDKSYKIIEKYSKISSVKIINQENLGIGATRNIGINCCKSKYVLFVDADDILFSDAIQKLMGVAIYNDADIVQGSYVRKFKNKEKKMEYSESTSFDKNKLNGYPWGKVIKKDSFKNINFPKGYYFEDTLLSMFVYQRVSKVVIIPDIVYKYRVNPNGIVHTLSNNYRAIDSFWITELILKNYEIYSIKKDDIFLKKVILKQFAINFRRCAFLKPLTIQKAIFELTIINFDRLDEDFSSLGVLFDLFIESIVRKNFNKFFVLCFLIKYI